MRGGFQKNRGVPLPIPPFVGMLQCRLITACNITQLCRCLPKLEHERPGEEQVHQSQWSSWMKLQFYFLNHVYFYGDDILKP